MARCVKMITTEFLIEFKCFSRTLLIFGRNGLKLNGAANLLVFLSFAGLFSSDFFLLSVKLFPRRF